MMSWALVTQSLYTVSLFLLICLWKVQAIGKKTVKTFANKCFPRDSPAEFSEPVELEEGVELKVLFCAIFERTQFNFLAR